MRGIKPQLLAGATALVVALAGSIPVHGAPATAPSAVDPEVLFVRQVRPLLQDKCLPCHGQDEAKIKGGLDLRTPAARQAGGDSFKPVVVAGRPEASPLYLAATRVHADWKPMPPKDNDALSPAQQDVLKTWILAGGVWPEEARTTVLLAQPDPWAADGQLRIPTSGGLTDDWTRRPYKPEDMWAFQPVQVEGARGGVGNGAVKEAGGPKGNPIDGFIDDRLAAAGLTPAPAADARTFIRRATFDLTGLPPTPEAIAAFEAASRRDGPAAIRALVEALLASPHYGEQWGRHWLDVVRYADSSGFANDYVRGSAWRYRDYVVRAFNSDKPYDRFVREQIAGDEIDPANPELLVATGLLRMGPWELTGMEVPKIARQRFLDDATDIVGQAFLGQLLQCARCHDHKFDPIPTRDYYALQAVFATTQLADRPAAFLPQENQAGFEEQALLDARREEHLATLRRLDEKSLAAAETFFAEKKFDPAAWRAAVAEARQQERRPGRREFQGAFATARNRMAAKGVAEDRYPPKLYGFTPEDYGNERVARKGLERLRWEQDRYQPVAFAVASGRTVEVKSVLAPPRLAEDRLTKGEREATTILTGGDPFSPGAPVSPGVLSAVPGLNPEVNATLPTTIEGRRRALADWITHPRHPLTARVMVNRIWQHHFSRPLAGNPNNFGANGLKPTHPELLDWLAATFVAGGWSVKAMHRLIMTSDVYRRAATHPDPAAVAARDPDGSRYAVARPRRLTAEELRDAMLYVTGELNPALGGIPARPEINLEAALQPRQVMGTFAEAWQPNPRPEQRHRRSLYALKIRGQRDPFMEVFNEPGPDLSCEARDTSTVTPQVFSLFNSTASLDRAVAFAVRLLGENRPPAATIDRAFHLAFGRPPAAAERAATLRHWETMTVRQATLTFARPEYPPQVVREAVEENTGEKFTFTEKLAAYDSFVPDRKPADVDARTRALADVCLVLLNANEFAYLY